MNTVMSNHKPRFSQHSKQAFRNPWVIGWIAAIVLVIGVNVAFIVTAVLTNPGLVEADYYEKGRDHERNFVSKQEQRSRLGWQMKLDAVSTPVVATPVRYTFSVVDNAGLPIDGEKAVINAYRPSDASADFNAQMMEIAPGIYSAEMTFPLKGIWDLTVTLHKGQDSLKKTRRISVQAATN